MRVACFLDEVDDDSVVAASKAAEFGIKNVVLRRLWSYPLDSATDPACMKLIGALKKHNLTVPIVTAQVAATNVQILLTEENRTKFNRALLLAGYFHASAIRIFPGVVTLRESEKHVEMAHKWLEFTSNEARRHRLVPLLQVGPECFCQTAEEIKAILNKYKMYLIYDPAALLVKRPQDVSGFHDILRPYIHSYCIRDFKIGEGFRPYGLGSVGWDKIKNDLKTDSWFLIDPCLGHRHGGLYGKQAIFKAAYEHWQKEVASR